jgi:hypothetical protein
MSEYIEFDLSPSKLPQDLLAAIGAVVSASSQTENVLNHAIAGCIGIDAEYMIAVTQHMPLPLKFSVLYSTAEIRIDDLDALDELDRLAADVKAALDQRNGIVHDSWAVSKKDGVLFRISQSARIRVELDAIPIAIEEVVKVGATVEAAGLALMKFLMLQGLLPPMPSGKPRGHKSRAARKKRRPPPV